MFKLVKVFDSGSAHGAAWNELATLAELRSAANGSYLPFWMDDDSLPALREWLKSEGGQAWADSVTDEKVLISYSW